MSVIKLNESDELHLRTTSTTVCESIEEDDSSFTEIKSKQVPDSDGFMTEYTMYKDNENDRYVFVFGDRDLYRPEDEDFDWECETEELANEWFDNYHGFDDDLEESKARYAKKKVSRRKPKSDKSYIDKMSDKVLTTKDALQSMLNSEDFSMTISEFRKHALEFMTKQGLSPEQQYQVLVSLDHSERFSDELVFNESLTREDCLKSFHALQDKAIELGVGDSFEILEKPEEVVGYYLETYGDEAFKVYMSNRNDAELTEFDDQVFDVFCNLEESLHEGGLKESVELDKFIDSIEDEGIYGEIKEYEELDKAPTIDGEDQVRLLKVTNTEGAVWYFVVKGFYWEVELETQDKDEAFNEFEGWTTDGELDEAVSRQESPSLPHARFKVGDIVHPLFNDPGVGMSTEEHWKVVNIGGYDRMNGYTYYIEPHNDVAKNFVSQVPEYQDGAEIQGFETSHEEQDWGLVEGKSYGGAFDIADDQYFTRDDINEVAAKIAELVSKSTPTQYSVSDADLLGDNVLYVELVDPEGAAFSSTEKIDMRRIKKPQDIEKYAEPIANSILSRINQFMMESVEYPGDKYKWLVVRVSDGRNSHMIPVAVEGGLPDKGMFFGWAWGERMHEYPTSDIISGPYQFAEEAEKYILELKDNDNLSECSLTLEEEVLEIRSDDEVMNEEFDTEGPSIVVARPGDYVDFGSYGKLYICAVYEDQYWVTDEEEDAGNPDASGWYISKYLAEEIISSSEEDFEESLELSI